MIDFNQLAKDIYTNEMTSKNGGIFPTEINLSTFVTFPTLQKVMPKMSHNRSDSLWSKWWDDWKDMRTKIIKRFGQITPEVEVIVIEKTLREHFDT